jgi:hypothetical protein
MQLPLFPHLSLGNTMNSTPSTPEYTLTLNDQDLQIIMKGLEDQAFKFSAPLVNKIAAQLNAQSQSSAPAAEVEHQTV